ncbi:polysaccharide deacetylase family protein [Anaeromassilibacillus senegalensis]|uniref:Polysaccharide deacetylase family protein n=1 Tax=Anaeromassilibacillus senegalensis TaxID=1673717 RepID=A0ABS9CP17_9FIRM|nr:polysaccharide deacetylase family protein [Anaeromassilibacillus senegalensis]MCF2652888.1 polysaccharide deacetylase family protein [Anaeromassilibacillus senegalensis]
MYGIVNLKRWLRYAAAAVLAAGAVGVFGTLLTVFAADSGVELPVIMYHAVIDDSARLGKYVISPTELENDFRWLKSHGYTAVLSEDLIHYTETGAPLPEKPVLITFDDGYYNNYLYAFPAAKQYCMKFVLSPIGKCADLYTETPDQSPYYAHATWEMLREMQDSGLVEIGNHTYDLHSSDGARLGTKRLSTESMDAYREMLSEDVLLFQEKAKTNLGREPVLFAYPFGAVSEGEPEIIAELGFKVTLSCEERTSTVTRDPQSLIYLGRYLRPTGETSEAFFSRILG